MSDLDNGFGNSGDILDADTIPNANQSHLCFSCNTPYVGLYCTQCGQKNDNYRRSILSLGKEAFSAFTAIENRIWRTWYHIIRYPGQVAREYSDGARERWSSPVRVYIAISILLFGYISLTRTQLVAFVPPAQTQMTAADGDQDAIGEPPAGESVETSGRLYFLERSKKIQAALGKVDIDAIGDNLGLLNVLDDSRSDLSLKRERAANIESIKDLERQIQTQPYGKQGFQSAINQLKTRVRLLDEEIAKREASVEVEIGAEAGVVAGVVAEAENPANPLQSQDIHDMAPTAQSDVISSTDLNPSTTPLIDAGDTDKKPVGDIKSGSDARHGKTVDDESNEDENTKNESAGLDGDNIIRISTGGETIELSNADMLKLVMTVLRQPERLNAPINTYIPRIMFLMMPFSMLMGALFIRSRENAMLYDHLVHAAYIHAFSFFLLFVFILLVQFTPIPGLIWLYTLILMVYLPLSAKRMFNRGWFKTIITSYSVGLIYTLLMMLILITLIISGLMSMAKELAHTSL